MNSANDSDVMTNRLCFCFPDTMEEIVYSNRGKTDYAFTVRLNGERTLCQERDFHDRSKNCMRFTTTHLRDGTAAEGKTWSAICDEHVRKLLQDVNAKEIARQEVSVYEVPPSAPFIGDK